MKRSFVANSAACVIEYQDYPKDLLPMNVCQEINALAAVKCVALDLDGVIYVGQEMLPGAAEAVHELRRMGVHVHFVTNSSGMTRATVASKLVDMGIEAREDEVITAACASAALIGKLARHESPRVTVLGNNNLKAVMEESGFVLADSAPSDFLVVGLDRAINYDKLCLALDVVLGGATFIACNKDARYPIEGGRLMPGCAAIVGAVSAACGREPDYYAGKPDVLMLQMLCEAEGLQPEEILMVGDSLESDITMANAFGSPSVHVLSAEGLAQLQISYASDQKATATVHSVVEVPALIRGF
jgi:HAD superfamily hydrolase (TIGR01450 family)